MDYDYEDLADEYDVEDYGIEPSKSEYIHEGYSENISLRPPLYELFYHCLTPTVGEAAAHLGKVLFYCVVFRLVCDYGPKRLKNLTSIGCGIMVTYHFFGPLTWYLAANATISYLVLQVSTVVLNRGRGVLTAVTSVVFLFLCELFIVASQDWHTIRGAQMLISMKVISIGFDIDSNHLLSVPMPMDFFGYIFCVGTIIFGPWTRFSDYAMIGHNKLGIIHNILVTSWKSAVALFFLSISTCWSFWIAPNGSYKYVHYSFLFLYEIRHALFCRPVMWT